MATPIFYVALAHTDNVARFTNEEGTETNRVTNINLFPSSMKQNLLFSMGYPSEIHYDTMDADLDPVATTHELSQDRLQKPIRLFADCGAYQFRNLTHPLLPYKKETIFANASGTWDVFKKGTLNRNMIGTRSCYVPLIRLSVKSKLIDPTQNQN